MIKVFAIGRLARDPEIRYPQGNYPTAVAAFCIAVDRRYKKDNEPSADFFNCTAFGKQAEFVEKYLRKGTKVALSGRLQNEEYEKDGQKRIVTKIIVDDIEFAESKGSQSGDGRPAPKTDKDGFVSIPDSIDDELPFA